MTNSRHANLRALLALCLCLVFCFSQNVQAYEGDGPLFERKGGYPSTIWQDLPREMLYLSIDGWRTDMNAIDRSIARRALLTPAKPKDWEEQTPEDKRVDFLSFRILALLRLAQFEDALRLYQHPNPDNLPDSVHKAGILATLFNQDTDLACLIQKTRSLEWARLDQLCADILSNNDSEKPLEKSSEKPKAEKNTKLQEVDAFLAMNLEDKAFAFAENSVSLTTMPDWARKSDPFVLRYLIIQPETKDIHKFIAHYQLLDYGLPALSATELESLDNQSNDKLFESVRALLDANLKSRKDIADKTQKQAFQSILDARNTLPHSLLDQLLGFNSIDIFEPELSFETRFDIALLYMRLGKTIPRFPEDSKEQKQSNDNSVEPEWIIRVFNEQEKFSSTEFKTWFSLYCTTPKPLFSNNLCTNIWLISQDSIAESDSDTPFSGSYEKFLFLTNKFDYVMHSIGVAGIYPVVGQDKPHGINIAVTPLLGLDNLYKMPSQQFKAVLGTLITIINKDQKKRIIAETTQLLKERN